MPSPPATAGTAGITTTTTSTFYISLLVLTLFPFLSFSPQQLWALLSAVAAVAFAPAWWNYVARREHNTRFLTRFFFGRARLACWMLAIAIVALNGVREKAILIAMESASSSSSSSTSSLASSVSSLSTALSFTHNQTQPAVNINPVDRWLLAGTNSSSLSGSSAVSDSLPFLTSVSQNGLCGCGPLPAVREDDAVLLEALRMRPSAFVAAAVTRLHGVFSGNNNNTHGRNNGDVGGSSTVVASKLRWLLARAGPFGSVVATVATAGVQALSVCDSLAIVLGLVGFAFVAGAYYQLGITGTYLGDYFGILLEKRITAFPFSVLSDPMYDGAVMLYVAQAILARSTVGLYLALIVWLVYQAAERYEGPFTAEIYAARDRQRAAATAASNKKKK